MQALPPGLKPIGLLLLGMFLVVFPFLHEWPFFRVFLSEFRTFNATMFAVWLLVLLGMNLLTGYSGQVSFGHAALVLASAYLTAVLSQQYAFPLWGAIGLSGAATAVVGWVTIGIPAVRLRGPYLAIATFGLMLAFPQILKLNALTRWTQGALGIRRSVVEPPGFLGGVLDGREWMYYVAMAAAVAMTVLFLNLTRSRMGRALVALRHSEVGAAQMGIDVPRHKALAFGISSLYAGIGGGLFFAVQGFVSPDSLGLIDSIFFLVAIVIGGLGSVLGSIVAALFLTFQSEAISTLAEFVPGANNLRNVFYGASLIAVIVLFPKGIAGFFQRPMWPKLRRWNLGRFWSSGS